MNESPRSRPSPNPNLSALRAGLPCLGPEGTVGARELVEAWLRARSKNTIVSYKHDLLDFSRFLGVSSLDEAAKQLLGHGHGSANVLALRYKDQLMCRNLSGATISRRLTALRSLVKLARVLGMIPWALEVEGIDRSPYRDTSGPGVPGVQAMIDALERRGGPQQLRDQLAIFLMFDLALRRNEIVQLDLSDVDLKAGVLWVLRKRKRERTKIGFPEPTRQAILDWLAVRGREPGPLLTSAKGGRLCGKAVWDLIKRAAKAARIDAAPHGLRHSSITAALDEGCDLRSVSRFAGHSSMTVTSVYDDRRKDEARGVAGQVANLLTRRRLPKPKND